MKAELLHLLAFAMPVLAASGCEPYRIEYHSRPAYYQQLVNEPLPDRIQLDDGTVIVYSTRGQSATTAEAESNTFQIREEMDDGSIELRALLPEHVVANTLVCLRNEEYQLLWDQMLSERTKLAYAEQGQGPEEFAAFLQHHRLEMAKMLNRMMMGLATSETVVENSGNGVLTCRFWPQTAQLFKFKRVAMVSEGFGLKLLLIY